MKSSTAVLYLGFIVLGIIFALSFSQQKSLPNNSGATVLVTPTPVAVSSSDSKVLGIQTKTIDCVAVNGLPDSACTPGAIFPGVTKDQVCQSGYSASLRSVSAKTKDAVYKEYGIISHPEGTYEVDHLVSLELGGSNDIANLWPESADPRPGFHEKDVVENYLHNKVCRGTMSLEEAQRQISTNWVSVYQQIQAANY